MDFFPEDEEYDPLAEELGQISISSPIQERTLQERIGSQRITNPIMTSFEKAALLAQRVKELDQGRDAPKIPKSIIDSDKLDAVGIANRELLEKKIPWIIRRDTNDGYFERWTIEELVDPDLGYSNI